MKTGFTLIELLAVIVILAIIALIATPIILGIINDAKEDANKRSVENYAHAVELAIVRTATKQGGVIEPGEYEIVPDSLGKKIKKGDLVIDIDYKGEAVTNGKISVDKDGKIEIIGMSFNGKSSYNYSESNGVTVGEDITTPKEITHLILPDGTLIYYKAKGDIKVPATLDGVAIKRISMHAFEPQNLILLAYIDNPEVCTLDSDKCTYAFSVYSLDSDITKEEIKYYMENWIGVLADDNDIIYSKSSDEILSGYNSLSSQGIEVELMAVYVEFENGQVADEFKYNKSEVTSIDLSELNNVILDTPLFSDLTNLKVVTLPKMENLDRDFYCLPNLEKIIVPYKEGEIPSTWNSSWNYDKELMKYHTIEYAG